MPHKHNDIKHGVDPEQIRRYLAGELDDKAMHILERQALEDPFLAEALDGFESYPADQTLNLAELDRRLDERVTEKRKRIIPLYVRWSAAAAVLLLAGLGVMKLWQVPVKQEVAQIEKKQDSVAPSAVTDESGQSMAMRADKPPVALQKTQAPERNRTDVEDPAFAKEYEPPVAAAPVTANADEKDASYSATPLSSSEKANTAAEKRSVAYSAAPLSAPAKANTAATGKADERNQFYSKQAVPSLSRSKALADTTPALDYALFPQSAPLIQKKLADTSTSGGLQGSIAGVSVAESKRKSKTRLLKGNVTDEKGSNALPGASVSVMGTDAGAITDKNGYFSIAVESTANVQLNVAAIGYNSQVLNVATAQNNLNIAMPESNTSLNEVVVNNYDRSQKRRVAYRPPEPPGGADSYKEYLEKHVHYPASADAVKGAVLITFSVQPDGSLTDFKVIRKLQPDCDVEAIRVVKEGPAWIPSSDGKSTRVFVDVPFVP